jgi:hypothetical protein
MFTLMWAARPDLRGIADEDGRIRSYKVARLMQNARMRAASIISNRKCSRGWSKCDIDASELLMASGYIIPSTALRGELTAHLSLPL